MKDIHKTILQLIEFTGGKSINEYIDFLEIGFDTIYKELCCECGNHVKKDKRVKTYIKNLEQELKCTSYNHD